MDQTRRRVWRASRTALILIGLLALVCLVGLPALAYLSWQARPSIVVPILLGVLSLLGLFYAWRFGWHPQIVATGADLVIKNPFRAQRLNWQEITLVLPGGNGLIVAGPGRRAEAWCVQKAERKIRSERSARADRVGDEIWTYWERHHPPVEVGGEYVISRARPGIEVELAELERRTSIEALSRIFPGQRFPFPIDSVTERWRDDLRDPAKQTFVARPTRRSTVHPGGRSIGTEAPPDDRLIGYLAHTANAVLHLGVAPDQQQHGCGTTLLDRAEAEMFTDPLVAEASLWILEDNQPALDFYSDHGWHDTDNRRRSPYPPKPPELRMIKANPRASRPTRTAGL